MAPATMAEDVDSGFVPDPGTLVARSTSSMAGVVDRYRSDLRALTRRHDVRGAAARREALRAFFGEWNRALESMTFDALEQEGRVDWLLLRNRIAYELRRLDREERLLSEVAPLVPFATAILGLQVGRRELEPIDPASAATLLDEVRQSIDATREALERGLKEEKAEEEEAPGKERKKRRQATESPAAETPAADEPRLETTKTLAHRAAQLTDGLREELTSWFGYYDGYHPSFSWWVRDPFARVDESLERYVEFLRGEIIGEKEGEDAPIVGDPIGRQALMEELALEMIPYTPEELMAIARRQFEWCDREMLAASRELGFGDDWHAALEKVKTLHVEPGDQPALVHRLADEAVDFLEQRDLLTIPALAKEIWRMEMMSPERQKVNPFFTGGEVIVVSFPTDAMSHEEKWMSMRGNNIHFSRATVHHELIPGHHLQGFMTERYQPHRRTFRTPYRIGMLFWRMHRCARILFSLGFHLGEMTPEEAIEFLIDRVGHEPENAEAEVRRSFEGSYPPLYQAAYMLGGLQIRSLHQQLVGAGRMTDREFHDAILQGGAMPIEMVRARLLGVELTRDYRATWEFAGTELLAVTAAGDER
jgi:hypothetical protein